MDRNAVLNASGQKKNFHERLFNELNILFDPVKLHRTEPSLALAKSRNKMCPVFRNSLRIGRNKSFPSALEKAIGDVGSAQPPPKSVFPFERHAEAESIFFCQLKTRKESMQI